MREQRQPRLPVGVVAPLPLVAVWCRVITRHALTPRIVGKVCQHQTVIVHQVRGVALRVKAVRPKHHARDTEMALCTITNRTAPFVKSFHRSPPPNSTKTAREVHQFLPLLIEPQTNLAFRMH